MKTLYAPTSVGVLSGLFGKSRQAYYQALSRADKQEMKNELVLKLVSQIRTEVKSSGTYKLGLMLKEPLEDHHIKLGRDKLNDLLKDHGLLLRKRKRKPKTTDSNHRFKRYPNLIKGITLNQANELWVCDITYISTQAGYVYLSLVTDAYSRKIVGYCLNPSLDRWGPINALKMALSEAQYLPHTLIHHSDRGVQYCCNEYIDLLTNHKILISMTENGDPYENAIAERVNGILKTEFSLHDTFEDLKQAHNAVAKSIEIYNHLRLHSSCDYLTPHQAHSKTGVLIKRWKNYRKHSDE